jgi:methyl-accepting chemotaxis protein
MPNELVEDPTDRYAVRFTLVLLSVAGATLLMGGLSVFEVLQVGDPTTRTLTLSAVVKLVLVALVSLLLVGVVLGTNTVTALESLAARAGRLADGDYDVEFESTRTDEFGAVSEALESMGDSLVARLSASEAAREEAEALLAAEAHSEHLQAKAEHYRAVLDRIAAGDLTARVDTASDSDAMAAVGHSINTAIGELETTVDTVQSFVDELARTSEVVDDRTATARDAAVEVDEETAAIAEGAGRQSTMLESVTRQLDGLSGSADEVLTATEELGVASDAAAEVSVNGNEAIEAAVTEMSDVKETTYDAIEHIDQLVADRGKVAEVTELITTIADQISILALNASIEAARSGEHGAGFAVVADEVKSLSEGTKEAATNINTLIEALETEADDAVEAIGVMPPKIDAGVDSVDTATAALDRVTAFIDDLDTAVTDINAAAGQQATSAQELVTAVTEVDEISHETARATERVTEVTGRQSTMLEGVAGETTSLSGAASDLRGLAERLQTRGSEVTAGSVDPSVAADGGEQR